MGKVVQFRQCVSLPREKRKAIQNPNWFFPAAWGLSGDDGVLFLPQNSSIGSKTWVDCERGHIFYRTGNRLGGRFDWAVSCSGWNNALGLPSLENNRASLCRYSFYSDGASFPLPPISQEGYRQNLCRELTGGFYDNGKTLVVTDDQARPGTGCSTSASDWCDITRDRCSVQGIKLTERKTGFALLYKNKQHPRTNERQTRNYSGMPRRPLTHAPAPTTGDTH